MGGAPAAAPTYGTYDPSGCASRPLKGHMWAGTGMMKMNIQMIMITLITLIILLIIIMMIIMMMIMIMILINNINQAIHPGCLQSPDPGTPR